MFSIQLQNMGYCDCHFNLYVLNALYVIWGGASICNVTCLSENNTYIHIFACIYTTIVFCLITCVWWCTLEGYIKNAEWLHVYYLWIVTCVQQLHYSRCMCIHTYLCYNYYTLYPPSSKKWKEKIYNLHAYDYASYYMSATTKAQIFNIVCGCLCYLLLLVSFSFLFFDQCILHNNTDIGYTVFCIVLHHLIFISWPLPGISGLFLGIFDWLFL